jgi:hypothetical protein
MSTEQIYIHFESCKFLFETLCIARASELYIFDIMLRYT